MLSVKEAQEIIKRELHIDSRSIIVETKSSFGYMLSEDVYSPVNIPYYPTSTRDGYAWNSKWTLEHVRLNTAKTIPAGKLPESTVTDSLETVYIATGGQLDTTIYDCVLMVEYSSIVEEDGIQYVIQKNDTPKLLPYMYVRKIGSDVSKGELLLSKGTMIQSSMIGLLLLAHIRTVNVEWKKIEFHLFSSGNELICIEECHSPTDDDKVVDCNRHMLSERCKEIQSESFYPLEINSYRVLEDNLEDVRDTISFFQYKEGFHIIITTGGASVGKFDYNKQVASELGTVYFKNVNMMPGKPITFCKIKENVFWFVLAGNPTSSMVQFDTFIRPICTDFRYVLSSPDIHVKCEDDFTTNDPKRVEYQRVRYDEGTHSLVKIERQQSSSLLSFVEASGYIHLDSSKKKGELAKYIPRIYRPLLDGKIRIGVITTSDRAYNGIYEDKSGVELQNFLKEKISSPIEIMYVCVSDDKECIRREIQYLSRWCIAIFTTGGTGPSYRDNTVTVTRECITKELPGFGERMRQISLQYTPTAILSGQTAGILYHDNQSIGCFICNCPGSPKSIRECLTEVWSAIPYCIELACGKRLECEGGYFPKK